MRAASSAPSPESSGGQNSRVGPRRGVVPVSGSASVGLAAVGLAVIGLAVIGLAVIGLVPSSALAQTEDQDLTIDDRPVVYLTFDGGPGLRTPEFLEVLQGWGVKATFFLDGRNAQRNPSAVEQIVAAGHTVGARPWSAGDLADLSPVEAQAELRLTAQALIETVGLRPRCWRPETGRITSEIRDVAAREHLSNRSWMPSGRWDVDTDDLNNEYDVVLDRLGDVKPDDVVRMHGGMNPDHGDLAALMTWLTTNASRYRFEGLPGCTAASTPSGRASAGGAGPESSPGALASADPAADLFNSDLDLWVEQQRGATYLELFGSSR